MQVRILTVATILAALAILFAGCTSSSEETKARVEKSHEQGQMAEKQQAEGEDAIDLSKLGQDPAVLERIILMRQSKIAERLPSFRFKAKLTYKTSRGETAVELTEQHELDAAKDGGFAVRMLNDKDKQYELLYTGGKTYDRLGSAEWRLVTNSGKNVFWREKIYGSLNRYYQYFRGHLRFNAPEPTRYKDREALKVTFGLDPEGKTPEEDLAVTYPFVNQYLLSAKALDKLINSNRKLVSDYDEAQGELVIDQKTGVILSYDVSGTYRIPMSEKQIETLKKNGKENPPTHITFHMAATYEMFDIGEDIKIDAPENVTNVERTPPPPSPKTGLTPEAQKQLEDLVGTKKTPILKPPKRKKAEKTQ